MISSSLLLLTKFSIVLAFLIYACKLDLESRIVPNKVWKYMLIFSLPFTFVEIYTSFDFLFIIYTTITLLLAYSIYLMKLFGGADAKAIMCLAVIFPLYPDPIFSISKGLNVGLSALSNSVIFVPALVTFFFIKNFIKDPKGFFRTPFYYFVGYKLDVDKIRFHYVLETVEGEKIKRLRKGLEASEEILKRLKNFGVKEVWVTPALPFLVFITFGYVATFIFGDLLVYIVANIIK